MIDTDTLDAEKAVTGAAFIDPNTIRLALDYCTPDDFGHPILGRVFDLMIGLRSAGLPMDEISVAKAARDRQYRNVTPGALFDLRAGTPSAGGVAYYAKIVHEGGVRRRMVAAGTRMVQLAQSDGDLTETLSAAQGEWQTVMGGAVNAHRTKTLREVMDGVDEYDWVIPDLLERSDRLLLTGLEGLGKSTLVRQIVIAAAAGIHPLRFTPMIPLTVVVVDAENSERQWRRKSRGMIWRATRDGQADPLDRVHMDCVSRMDLTSDRDLGVVHAMLDEHQPDIMAIGPLYKLVPRAINNDDDAAPLINALDSIRARGVALVMEAHAGHARTGGGERDLRPRGSAALLGWPEFGYGLTPDLAEDPGGSVVRLVRWRGDRDERAWPDALVRGGDWPWSDYRPTETAARYAQQSAPAEERYR
jgi:replicative DNA helicase